MSADYAGAQRLRSIDVLRGTAILLVLAIHIPHDAPGGWRENPWFFPAFLAGFGYFGVPLFILISGFCIHRAAAQSFSTLGHYRFSWRQFWVRRFIRLYPPYVAAIAFALVAAIWLHGRFPDWQRFLGWDLATHLLLVHNLTAEFASSLGNGAFWSLGTEEQLYALYFLLLVLMTRGSGTLAIGCAATVTIGWRLLVPHVPDPGLSMGDFHLGKWYHWPLNYWLHWALGALAVDAFYGNRKLPNWCRSLPIAAMLIALGLLLNRKTFDLLTATSLAVPWLREAGAVVLATWHSVGEIVVVLGCFCLLNWSLRRERDSPASGPVVAAFAWVGRISYSLYLVHVPVIYILEERLSFGSSILDWPLRYLSYGAITIAAGFLFHLAVERWFLHGRLPLRGSRVALTREQA